MGLMPIQILELFGGIGAPRAAMRNIGQPVKSIDYVEIDEKAVRSYNAMFADDMKQKAQDVRGWNLKPDILIHGSPCQDFSIAGRQKGADEGSETRSSLMWETLRIIENLGVWKPRVVIWENVKNVLSKHMKHNFQKYLDRMEELGYVNSYQILDARDFGLPQRRERVFTISILGGPAFDFDRLQKRPMRPLSDFLEDSFDSGHILRAPSMIAKIGKKTGNFNGKLRILDPDGACDCITTAQDRCPNSGVVRLPDGSYRVLTERECWRLQGFNDSDFDAANSVNPKKPGLKSGALYKQAGNSMPVPIMESIFEVLLKDEMKSYIVDQPSILSCIGKTGDVRRTTVIEDEAMTITTRQDRCPAQVIELAQDLYRFLTEKECWKLMGFSDSDFEAAKKANPSKGRMNRALYKQAGNSMPVPILESLFQVLLEMREFRSFLDA